MANNAVLLLSMIVFLAITKIQGKKNKNEKISFFLTKYEITEIVDVEYRSSRPKHPEIKGAQRSFRIKAFGDVNIIDLSFFYPRQDSEIAYISKLSNSTDSFLSSGFLLYQGYVRNFNNSFVLASFTGESAFRGYIVKDEIFCIEPYEPNKVIVYRFKDVIAPGCIKKSEDEDLDCSETRYFAPWHANRAPPARLLLPNYNLFYNKYLEFFQAQKAEEKKGQEQKKNSSVGRHHGNESKEKNAPKEDRSKCISCHNNKSAGKHKTEKVIMENSAYYSRKKSNCRNKTIPEMITESDSNGKIKQKKNRNDKSKTTDKKEEKENDCIDDDDDDEILKDDERFEASESNLGYKVHLVDKNENPSETSKLNINDSGSIMDQFFNNIKSLPMWKESSIEDVKSFKKQAGKGKEKLNDKDPIVEALESEPIETYQCSVQVVVAPSLVDKFDGNIEMVIKDIYVQFILLNKIISKVPLRRNDKAVHFILNIAQIVIHGDQVYSPFTRRADLEYFTKTNRVYRDPCLTIGLVNQYLRSGELFDGFTPEGKGGICSKDGNTLIVSHGNENTPAPMALYFAALMRGVTRSIGARDKDEQCSEGSYPNPMQILRDYILAEKITPSTSYSIFTQCNVKEIEDILKSRNCLERVSQPLCGNAILDPGEECDCGPAVLCNRIDPCCNTPHMLLDPKGKKVDSGLEHKSCTLTKGAKCSNLQGCCDACQFNKREFSCFSGPGDCDIAMCDGKSASCPTGVEASNGMICSINDSQTEPFVCKDNKCDRPLCSSFKLEPCTCAMGTAKECFYCCVKDGRCKAAGTELKLFPDRNFHLPDGTECMGGSCWEGKCIGLSGMQQIYNYTLKKPPRFPATSDSPIEFSTFQICIGTVLFIFGLFLLQPVT